MRASPADFYIYSQEIAAAGDEETVRVHMELFAEVKLEQLEEESEEDRTRILAPFGGDFRAFVQDAAAQLDIAGTTRRSREAARRNVGHARNEQLAGLRRDSYYILCKFGGAKRHQPKRYSSTILDWKIY